VLLCPAGKGGGYRSAGPYLSLEVPTRKTSESKQFLLESRVAAVPFLVLEGVTEGT